MKKYKLIARSDIINPNTWRVHDDFGLKALDGYAESSIYEADDSMSVKDICDMLESEIVQAHPGMRIDRLELIELTE